MCWGWSVKWINTDPFLTRLTIQWGSYRNELSPTGVPTCQEQDEIVPAPIPWWFPSAEVFGKTNPERLHRYNYTKVLPDETDLSKRKDILSHRCCPFQESKIQKLLPSQRQMWEIAGGHCGLAQNGFWAGGGQQRTKDTGRMGGGREKEEKEAAIVKLHGGWSNVLKTGGEMGYTSSWTPGWTLARSPITSSSPLQTGPASPARHWGLLGFEEHRLELRPLGLVCFHPTARVRTR